jgi:hypothetical protein
MRIGLDFDGVICATPFGRLAVHAPGEVPRLPEGYERLYDVPVSSSPLGMRWNTCGSRGVRPLKVRRPCSPSSPRSTSCTW